MFGSLAEALAWVKPLWGDVLIPWRMNDHATGDDGAPRLSGVVLRYLDAQAMDCSEVTYTQDCYHWRLPAGDRLMGCPDCHGRGTFEKSVTRFRYPMRAALSRLDGIKPYSPLQPRPIAVVMTLARTSWHLNLAASVLGQSVDTMEALSLMGLRQLHERYVVAPTPSREWISGRSDAQRSAESAIA